MRDHYADFNGEAIRAGCVERFSEGAIVNRLSEIYLPFGTHV